MVALHLIKGLTGCIGIYWSALASSAGNSLAKISKSIMNNSEFKVRDC
jgi:hypothetical protein